MILAILALAFVLIGLKAVIEWTIDLLTVTLERAIELTEQSRHDG